MLRRTTISLPLWLLWALAPILIVPRAASQGQEEQRIVVLPGAGERVHARIEFVAAGWLEPEENAGAADLSVMLLDAAARAGGPGDLRVDRDAKGIHFVLSCAAQDLPAALARAGALRRTTSFSEQAVARMREQLQSNLALRAGDPNEPDEGLVVELLTGQRPPAPRPETLAAVDAEALAAFLESALSLERMWVAATGPVPTDRVHELIEQHVGAPAPSHAAAMSLLFGKPPGLRGRVLDLDEATRCDLRLSLEVHPIQPHYAELLLLADLFVADPERNPEGSWTVVAPTRAGARGPPLYLYRSVPIDATVDATIATALEGALSLFDGLEDLEDEQLEAVRARRIELEQRRGAEPQVQLARALERVRPWPSEDDPWTAALDRLAGLELEDLEQVVESLPARPLALTATGPASALEPVLAEHMPVEVSPGRSGGPASKEGDTPQGRALTERLLAAVGGRERWGSLRTLSTLSVADLARANVTVKVESSIDLEHGFLRMNNDTGSSMVTWIVRPDAAWSLIGPAVSELDATSAGRLRERHSRLLFVVLHELAAGKSPPARVGPDGRLELVDANGVWCWLLLGEDGRPTRLGYQLPGEGLETVYHFSEWTEADGWHYPARVHQLDRGNEYATERFEPNAQLSPKLFERQ